jgi:hypothetical protein
LLTKAASRSLTTPSTAAKSSSIRVSTSINRRAVFCPDSLSYSRIFAKNAGDTNPAYFAYGGGKLPEQCGGDGISLAINGLVIFHVTGGNGSPLGVPYPQRAFAQKKISASRPNCCRSSAGAMCRRNADIASSYCLCTCAALKLPFMSHPLLLLPARYLYWMASQRSSKHKNRIYFKPEAVDEQTPYHVK